MKKENLYNLLLLILIFLTILSIILLKPIDDLDELWNYNFARNFANGLVPYRDFNMVVTPFLSIVCGFILKITFNELIVMRILAALLCASIIYITYKIFNILDINKRISIIFAFAIGFMFQDIFCVDYNYFSLLLALIIIYIEIKSYKVDNKFLKANIREDFVLGFLAGLSILTKQTSGLLICAALLGNKLLFVRKKGELKVYFKSFCYRLLGLFVPITIFIMYLLTNNAVNDFISYTIKGVSEFKNVIPYKTMLKFDMLGILSVLVPITFVYAWVKSIVLEKTKLHIFF